MIDVAPLAEKVVLWLAPALPYLVTLGEKTIEGVGEKIGEDAWEKAKALWKGLKPKVEDNPFAKRAVENVATAPTDPDAQATLRLELKKLLANDPVFTKEIHDIWSGIESSGVKVVAAGERSVAIGGSATNSPIITGDNSGYR